MIIFILQMRHLKQVTCLWKLCYEVEKQRVKLSLDPRTRTSKSNPDASPPSQEQHRQLSLGPVTPKACTATGGDFHAYFYNSQVQNSHNRVPMEMSLEPRNTINHFNCYTFPKSVGSPEAGTHSWGEQPYVVPVSSKATFPDAHPGTHWTF